VIFITACLTIFVEWTAQYIPFEFETALSQPFAEPLNKEANEVDQYLQQLANKIIPYMDLPGDVEIHLHYVNEDTVNAMATLGGHVMIYRGLLEQLPDENTLVMLLGHEIGHVKLRHPVQALGKGMIISLVMSAILGQSSDSVANVTSDTSLLTMLSFNRDQEQDSDEEGIKVLNAYYGGIQGATELFEILEQAQQEEGIEITHFLSSHPDTKNRKNHLNELAKTQGWTQQGKPEPIPGYILKIMAADKQRAKEDQT
jgi:predicted Zn-dependent protease